MLRHPGPDCCARLLRRRLFRRNRPRRRVPGGASLGLASAANDAASAQSAVGFPRGDALISRRAARRPRESLGGLHGRQRSFRRGSATWAAPRRALAVEPYSGGRQMRGSGVGGGASPAHGTHTRVSGVRPHSLTFHLSFELDEITRGVPCHQEMKILKDIVQASVEPRVSSASHTQSHPRSGPAHSRLAPPVPHI